MGNSCYVCSVSIYGVPVVSLRKIFRPFVGLVARHRERSAKGSLFYGLLLFRFVGYLTRSVSLLGNHLLNVGKGFEDLIPPTAETSLYVKPQRMQGSGLISFLKGGRGLICLTDLLSTVFPKVCKL